MTNLHSLSPSLSRNSPIQNSQAALRSAGVNAQSTLANRLADKLGLDPGSLNGKTSNDYTPDKVADRVLGFISQRIQKAQASGADTGELEKLMSQAKEGIEKGFADARKILDNMGALTGKVASDIDSTYSKIQDGLKSLQSGLLPSSTGGSTAVSGKGSNLVAQAQTFDLQITTNDGDRLRVSIAKASADWSQSDDKGSSSGSIKIAGWQVSVDGELDDDERAALDKLFKQVQDISDKFYAGDLNGAFDRAMQLDMDNTQLASMSLRLTQTNVRQATDAYNSVAQPTGEQGQSGQPISAVNGSLMDYARSLLDALSSSNQVSEDGKGTLQQLLQGGFSLDDRFDSTALDKAKSLNQRLLDGLQNVQDLQNVKDTKVSTPST